MIKLAEFASSAAALSLADYCKNQQLDVSVVVHSAQQAELWCAPEHAEQVMAELERFYQTLMHRGIRPRPGTGRKCQLLIWALPVYRAIGSSYGLKVAGSPIWSGYLLCLS